MRDKELFIIGNGFDIHHGMQSRYSNFKEYLSRNNIENYYLVDKYLPVDESWADLEECLAHIDIDSVVDSAAEFLVSYAADDWSDAYHHDYQYEVNKIIRGLSSELLQEFTLWINQLTIPNKAEVTDKLLNLPQDGKYLTFNYTNTLQNIYGISKNNILFIHGEAKNNGSLILGHAWDPVSITQLSDISDPESIDTRVMEGDEIINQYFGRTFKNTEKIIQDNFSFFCTLQDISTIHVMGHSMSGVDIDYFATIIEAIDLPSTYWRVSYYGESDLENKRQTVNGLRINKSMVEYLLLDKM